MGFTSVELFSGIGGLALGLSRAGYQHALLVEYDHDACAAVEYNKQRGVEHISSWPLVRRDVRDVDWSQWRGQIDVIAGGPPCQPFAIGGKKQGHSDRRDMWPEAMRALREIDPAAFVFENVRNLAGPQFKNYLAWVIECMRHPNYPRRDGESHLEHLARLRTNAGTATYSVDHVVVNAADFGAPQIRWRVLIRGRRGGDGLPDMTRTHTLERLLWDQWVSGDYWKRHGISRPPDDAIPNAYRTRVTLLRGKLIPPKELPWITVRDAIGDLGEPNGINHHLMQYGARAYKGHTGSPLDLPSKALKAGDHGVPGGENMLVLPDGSVRYLTMREAARLVNLPDGYAFPASWTETMRGLGNAVPAALGEAVGQWLKEVTKTPAARRPASRAV